VEGAKGVKPEIFRRMGAASATLPEFLYRAILGAISRLGYATNGGRQKRALREVLRRVLAFQKLPAGPADVDALYAKHLRFYVESLLNLSYICRPAERPATRIPVDLPILAEIEKQRARGKGVVLATPHYGDLYSAIIALGRAGLPLTVLMVTGDNYHWAEFDKLKFVEFAGGAADCLKALNRNEAVLVYSDLDFFPGNRTADFFGAPAFPPHGPARLALATGAAIIPLFARWSPSRVEVAGEEAILPAEGAAQEDLEAALLRSLERGLARNPEQWMMIYDLWNLDEVRAVARTFTAKAAR
jgi:KDO2-lipid IV(A) lauroyltransferase